MPVNGKHCRKDIKWWKKRRFRNPHIYNVMSENNKGETIHYSQHDSAEYTINITYDEKDGYRKKIDLGGMEAYSVSNGETNSIFFEKDGYVFTVMSGQSEETMITWIENSGILPK